MKRFRFLLPGLLVLACTPSSIVRQLDTAEAYLNDAPDSALSVLSKIDDGKIVSDKENARFALLLSAAYDKNYIDVTSDTLIRKAVDYYAGSQDARRRMLAYYYSGRVQMNMQDLPSAIFSLEKAERDAHALGDDYYLGLIHRNKSDIYNHYYNNLATIQNDRAAISAFGRAGKTIHQEYARLSLAIDFVNGKKFEEASVLLDSLEAVSTDANLIYQARLLRAQIAIENGERSEEAIRIYEKTPPVYLNYINTAYWAIACERSGQKERADEKMTESYRMALSDTDSATLHFMYADILHGRGKYADAYGMIQRAALAQDSLTRVRLNRSLDGALNEYYKNEIVYQEQEKQQMKARLWLTVLSGVLLILLLCAAAQLLVRQKNSQMKEYLAQFATGQEELEIAIKQNALLIGSIYSERLYHLDELSRAYYEKDDIAAKEALFKEFKEKVFSLRDDERLFSALEEDLNTHCNDLMRKFRAQVPNVKGESLKMVVLLFAGFPYKTIEMVLRKNSVAALRTAKSRLKRTIIEAEAPDGSVFLSMLEKE